MKLYMIRHGQSRNNLELRHSGHSLTPLTDKGIKEAREAGKLLKKVKFDKIYTSDLTRCVQTCENALPNCEYEKLELIREVNVGTLTDRLIQDCIDQYGDTYVTARAAYDFRQWNGENFDMTTARVIQFLKMLEDTPCEAVAAFSHGTFIEYILCYVLGYGAARNTILNNGGICVFEYKNKIWNLVCWNYKKEL